VEQASLALSATKNALLIQVADDLSVIRGQSHFGISFERESVGAGVAGVTGVVVVGAGMLTLSITLPDAVGLFIAMYARPRLVMKNTAAKTPVKRDRKLAEPDAPNKLPDAPLPKAAPMSAPLPCCSNTKPTTAMPTIM
jgi:hypothetical protein